MVSACDGINSIRHHRSLSCPTPLTPCCRPVYRHGITYSPLFPSPCKMLSSCAVTTMHYALLLVLLTPISFRLCADILLLCHVFPDLDVVCAGSHLRLHWFRSCCISSSQDFNSHSIWRKSVSQVAKISTAIWRDTRPFRCTRIKHRQSSTKCLSLSSFWTFSSYVLDSTCKIDLRPKSYAIAQFL